MSDQPLKHVAPYLTVEEALTGAPIAFKNAQSLLAISQSAAKDRHYGAAVALHVLAVEEASKAYALFVYAAVPEEANDKFLVDIFRHHKLKHGGAALTLFWVYYGMTLKTLYEEVEEKIKQGAPPELTRKKMMKEFIATVQSWSVTDDNPLARIMYWYKEANALKNRGFYVDWQTKTWKSPAEVTLKEYETAEEVSQMWFLVVENALNTPIEQLAQMYKKMKENTKQEELEQLKKAPIRGD